MNNSIECAKEKIEIWLGVKLKLTKILEQRMDTGRLSKREIGPSWILPLSKFIRYRSAFPNA